MIASAHTCSSEQLRRKMLFNFGYAPSVFPRQDKQPLEAHLHMENGGRVAQSGPCLIHLQPSCLQHATSTNTLARLDTSLKSGKGTGEPVSTPCGSTFQLCLCLMHADRQSLTGKSPMHPSLPRSTDLRGSSGSELEQACVQKDLDALGCLAICFYSLQREYYSNMQGS